MPQITAQLKKREEDTTKNNNVYYKLTFKPKGEPEFRVSTFHASGKELEINNWYSVTYEQEGQYKNVKGKDDIEPAQEPPDPSPRTGGAPAQTAQGYALPDHPTKRRSIEVQTALNRAVDLCVAGQITVDEIWPYTEKFYRAIATIGRPASASQGQQHSPAGPPDCPTASGNGHSGAANSQTKEQLPFDGSNDDEGDPDWDSLGTGTGQGQPNHSKPQNPPKDTQDAIARIAGAMNEYNRGKGRVERLEPGILTRYIRDTWQVGPRQDLTWQDRVKQMDVADVETLAQDIREGRVS